MGRWRVFAHGEENGDVEGLPDALRSVLVSARGRVRREREPFLLGPDGVPDAVINDFFRSLGPGGALSELSARTYAYSIATYCNLLAEVGADWRSADPYDFGRVRDLRRFGDETHPLVAGSTWQKDFQAIRELYRWAAGFGIVSPIVPRASFMRSQPGAADFVRSSDVKWFTPAAVAFWADLGLRGLLPDSVEASSFRGHNSQRDSAFASVLFRTGLRVQEAGNLLLGVELLENPGGRRFVTSRVASALAKGGRGRKFWMPVSCVSEVGAYVWGERARSVGQARARGVYDDLGRGWLFVSDVSGGVVRWRDGAGRVGKGAVDMLGAAVRRRLLVRVDGEWEPMMVWVTDEGLPLSHQRWNAVFRRANARVLALGAQVSPVKPHHLRHSFALRWFAVGKLLWMGRTAGLEARERARLRDEMPSEWFLVQTLLGHRNVETTRNTYLEPFADLDIELLMAHAEDESTSALLAHFLSRDPRVEIMGAF